MSIQKLLQLVIFICLLAAPFVIYTQRKKYIDLSRAMTRFRNTGGIDYRIFDEDYKESFRDDDYLSKEYFTYDNDKSSINKALIDGHNVLVNDQKRKPNSVVDNVVSFIRYHDIIMYFLIIFGVILCITAYDAIFGL